MVPVVWWKTWWLCRAASGASRHWGGFGGKVLSGKGEVSEAGEAFSFFEGMLNMEHVMNENGENNLVEWRGMGGMMFLIHIL